MLHGILFTQLTAASKCTDRNQVQATIPADTRLNKLPYAYFVLIYIDADGTVRLQVSESIANNWPAIQSAGLIDEFLGAVSMSSGTCISKYQGEYYVDPRTVLN